MEYEYIIGKPVFKCQDTKYYIGRRLKGSYDFHQYLDRNNKWIIFFDIYNMESGFHTDVLYNSYREVIGKLKNVVGKYVKFRDING